MARIRSPGYPSFSLEQVVEFAGKIHLQDRQHPVDRETTARHIGFSGLSGASDRALSALLHYGLMEKVQKGEMRIADLALRILHPDSPSERRASLHLAGFSPDLFKELRDRYPEAPPSRDSLSSYLLRSGFASAAIPTATKAYLETCYYLQREHAYDLSVAASAEPSEPATFDPQPETVTQPQTPSLSPAQPPTGVMAAIARVGEPVLNKINMNIQGERVHIDAVLDYKGLLALEKKIIGLKALMDPGDDIDDGGEEITAESVM